MLHSRIQESIFYYLISQNLSKTAKRLKKESQWLLAKENLSDQSNEDFVDLESIFPASIQKDGVFNSGKKKVEFLNGTDTAATFPKKRLKQPEIQLQHATLNGENNLEDKIVEFSTGITNGVSHAAAGKKSTKLKKEKPEIMAPEALTHFTNHRSRAGEFSIKREENEEIFNSVESIGDLCSGALVTTSEVKESKVLAQKTDIIKTKTAKTRSFKRVADNYAERVEKESLKNNSFWNKKSDSFAMKAAIELGRVRGKDFRHEKSKKKKASWRGIGAIPTGVNSIMFDSD